MTIHVEMEAQEFQEFLQWRGDRNMYQSKNRKMKQELDLVYKKIPYAVQPDPKKEGKYKIIDQEHMDDLWLLAMPAEEGGGCQWPGD